MASYYISGTNIWKI